MDYFILVPDKRVANPLKITVEESILQSMEPFVVNTNDVDSLTIVDMIVSKILFNSYFFLSDGMKNVFMMYDNEIDMVPMLITNEKFSVQLPYWLLEVKATENVVANKFLKSRDMLVNEAYIKDKPIHKIYYEKQTFILVNCYVAESILRRLPTGIYFQKVETVKEGVENGSNIV